METFGRSFFNLNYFLTLAYFVVQLWYKCPAKDQIIKNSFKAATKVGETTTEAADFYSFLQFRSRNAELD